MIEIEINCKKNCSGCYACANICPESCIEMEIDNEGFWYPKVNNKKCTQCETCIEVCPVINNKAIKNNPISYACINKDQSIRMQSSSGGIFTIIAEKIIAEGGVVFGAGFNESFEVTHSCADNIADIAKFRGSKYVQSKIGDTYKQAEGYLKSGRKVLFSGTPCQISGLKYFLNQPYKDLLCLDIICHGVPSPKVWEKYIDYQKNIAGSSPEKISFRWKNESWKKYSLSILFKNKKEYRKSLDKDLYMTAFLNNISLRPSCYDCKFKTLHRESDITLADFWGVEYILPEMYDDKGTSLIFVNSKTGIKVFEKIKNDINWQEANINKAVEYNSCAIISVSMNPKRELFFKDLDKIEFNDLIRKHCKDKFTILIKRKIKSAIKNLSQQGSF